MMEKAEPYEPIVQHLAVSLAESRVKEAGPERDECQARYCRAIRPFMRMAFEAGTRSSNLAMSQILHDITERYVALANSGDAGRWDAEHEPEVSRAREALRGFHEMVAAAFAGSQRA